MSNARDQKRAAELLELLEPFKRNDNGMGVALLIDDDLAMKIAAAWTLFALPDWRKPRTKPPVVNSKLWAWIWSGFELEEDGTPAFLEALAQTAGVPMQGAFNRWPSIMASRLVYPDGTIAETAQGAIASFVERHLPRRPAPPPLPRGPKE